MNSIYLDFFTFKTVYILFFCVLLHIEKPKIKGKMPEWSIGTVSKTVVPVWVPRVRIPLFPQTTNPKPLQVHNLQRFFVYKKWGELGFCRFAIFGSVENPPH